MSGAAFSEGRRVPPSDLVQTWVCFQDQLRSLARRKSAWALLLLVPTIPVLYAVISTSSPQSFPDTDVANVCASYVLAALPLASALVSSSVCGSMLAHERASYIVLPLPTTRRTLFIGGFMAGFSVCAAVVLAAYGIAIAMSVLGQ